MAEASRAAFSRTKQRRDIVGKPAAVDPDHQHGLFFQGPDGRPQFVSTAALEETFGAAGSSVKLVVLNACYSDAQAKALLVHVGCVVGMRSSIRDDAARNFAIGLYGGLGERESVAASHRQGCAAIVLEGLSDGDKPRLTVRDGVDADRLVLAIDPLARATAAKAAPGDVTATPKPRTPPTRAKRRKRIRPDMRPTGSFSADSRWSRPAGVVDHVLPGARGASRPAPRGHAHDQARHRQRRHARGAQLELARSERRLRHRYKNFVGVVGIEAVPAASTIRTDPPVTDGDTRSRQDARGSSRTLAVASLATALADAVLAGDHEQARALAEQLRVLQDRPAAQRPRRAK